MGRLLWEFPIQPTAVSRLYTARLEYRETKAPRVLILSPDLTALAGERAHKIPHVYSHTHPVRLCLYDPSKWPWTPHMAFATTIVPWTYLWLYYFEEWLFSNEWKGGGEHPGDAHEDDVQLNAGDDRTYESIG